MVLESVKTKLLDVLKQNLSIGKIVLALVALYILHRLFKKWKYSHNQIKRINQLQASTNDSKLPNEIHYANVPTYRVNLDTPAHIRWDHVVKQYIATFNKAHEIMNEFLLELLPHPIFIPIARCTCSLLIYLRLFPHSNEWIGIAETLHKSPGELGVMHISYELTSFCTSILINDKSIFGTIINLRTMDWSLPFDLRQFTAKIHFVNNNGDIIYTSVMFIGSLGVCTALKSNKFSIVVNFRNSAYNNVTKSSYITLKTILGFIYNLGMILIGGCSVTSSIRYICENANDYDEAVRMAKESWLISPTFITITGNKLNEGVILTRDRLRCLDENRLDIDDDMQYIVQCNSDHWTINELNKYSDIYESKERVDMAHDLLPVLLAKEDSFLGNLDVLNIVDDEYKDNEFTDEQLKFIAKCWRLLSVDPIRNEETIYGNIIIPKYNAIFAGITTTAFESVSAKEFKDMFFISPSSV